MLSHPLSFPLSKMHKKFVLRSRIEARDVVAKVTALEAEINRLTTLIDATEEELHAKRCFNS